MSYLDPGRQPAANDPAVFGFQMTKAAEGWRWTAFDPLGRVAAEGVAPTKAIAAANVIRALART